jgi:hypothetical protein
MLNAEGLMSIFVGLFLIVGCVVWLYVLYAIPVAIAQSRKHSKLTAIRVCSAMGFFFFPCWCAAIVWAFCEDNRAKPVVGFPVVPLGTRPERCALCSALIQSNDPTFIFGNRIVCERCYKWLETW